MFEGKGKSLSETGLSRAADALGVGLPALWAVMTVETKGCGFLPDRRPLVLFERHIFHKRTQGRFRGQAPDLSDPVAGGYQGSTREHDRLLRAIALDRKAALESTSWGLGQVMGFNATSVDRVPSCGKKRAKRIRPSASSSITTRSWSGMPEIQGWVEASRCSSIPTIGRRSRLRRCLPRPGDFSARPCICRMSFVHVYETLRPCRSVAKSWKCRIEKSG